MATTPPGQSEAPPDGEAVDGELWEPKRPRLGPALVVLGVAAVVGIGGAAVSLIGSGQKPIAAAALGRLPGVALAAESAKPVLAHISAGGDPPTDIVDALVVPAGSVYVRRQLSSGLQLFSASVSVSVNEPPAEVLAFYRAELRHDGWSSISTDAAATGSGEEVLAQHPSSDGYYWGVGAVVQPVTPSLSPALAGGDQQAPTSALTLSVYEIDDAD
jgi:hypothetical protein